MTVDCINDGLFLCRMGISSRTGTYHSDEMTRGTLFLFYTRDVRIIVYIYNVFTYGTQIPHLCIDAYMSQGLRGTLLPYLRTVRRYGTS